VRSGQTLTTDGTLLNGRIHHRQPATGFRSGLEPVLLAASIQAKQGEHVLEAGTGAGAAALCLYHRLGPLQITAVEIDPALAHMAQSNAAANGYAGVEIVTGDIGTARFATPFDHAMANPPYHAADATESPLPGRNLAKRATDDLLEVWIATLARNLKRGGTLTLIVTAAAVPVCLTALHEADCRCAALYPLWPKRGRTARLILLRGIKASRRPFTLHPGLVLHNDDGGFTPECDAVLREGAALKF
jgi:tRNA1Val (adenine37-N6)-methyltransferase